ncbi:UNVERIFIED_CONTAM: ATP synthase gamma chain, chloroplastic [Sesamum radiatum]|uniref:F-ATPase gamma subunit n=1 Tax=Sesamum radiatum TaxID=300843 RepID=A0AAW2T299_SESRA
MFLGFFSSKSRNFLFRGLHFAKQSTRPSAEDIIFRAVCVNIRQKKWKFLDQLSSSLTNSLLSRVFLEFQSSPQLLLEVYRRVGGQKAILDSLESCCILIHVLVDQRNYDEAVCLMKELMMSKGYLPLEVLEALINCLSVCSPSSAVFDALIRACTQIGATESAYGVIKKLRMENHWVSIHAWNNFLNHLLKIGEVQRFWMVYREMISYEMLKRGIVPNVVGFNMLINGACSAEDLDLAVKLLKKMGAMSGGIVSPNAVTYNCLINGYCKKGKLEIAKRILAKMIEMDVKPNIRTYATLIDGYSRNGYLEEAFRLCNNMVENGLIPNTVVTYGTMIDGYCKAGEMESAAKVYTDMVKVDKSPNLVIFNSRWTWLRILTYTTLVTNLSNKRSSEEVVKLHDHLVLQGVIPDSQTYEAIPPFCRAQERGCRKPCLARISQCGCPQNLLFRTLLHSLLALLSLLFSSQILALLALQDHQLPAPFSAVFVNCVTVDSVKNTQKITEAMKLVAAAKVRRAQEAVVNARPFSETLVEVLYNINEQLQTEDIDIPLTKVRPVKKVALVVVTGDRGLCGGFNNAIIKKAESRIRELKELGLDYTVISVGKKGNSYFIRRPYIPVDKFLEGSSLPTAKEAQAIADDVFSLFVSEEVDKVELLYTKFVSLVKSDPVIHTLLPLSPKGEICDVNGICVDAAEDEFFRLTTKEGKLTVERDVVRTKTSDFSPILQFEQDPVQILDALLPLYLNSQILRSLQESLASELAARMSAMSNATDNAVELKRNLSRVYNRERQAKITGEILRSFLSQRFGVSKC